MQLNLVGNLDEFGIRSPWAKDPIGVGVGAEYRQEAAAVRPDHNLQIGNLVGNNQIVATDGGFRVGEGYGEMRVPIIQDMEFARDLTFEGSGRFSSYDRAGSTWTWKAGLEWQVIDDIKFRVAQERSVRAPNVSELFTPAGGTSANPGKDPCSAAGNNTPTTAALCIATGVPAASVFTHQLDCPTNQCQGAIGGNPFLKPENSNSRTLGIVFTPTFIPGLTATVDWYDIKIAGFVTAIPAADNSRQLLQHGGQHDAERDKSVLLVHPSRRSGHDHDDEHRLRGPGRRQHRQEQDRRSRLRGELRHRSRRMGHARLGFVRRRTGSRTGLRSTSSRWSASPASVLWGSQCGEPEPRFKSNLRLTWADSDNEFSVSVKWRHLSGVEFETQPVWLQQYARSRDSGLRLLRSERHLGRVRRA